MLLFLQSYFLNIFNLNFKQLFLKKNIFKKKYFFFSFHNLFIDKYLISDKKKDKSLIFLKFKQIKNFNIKITKTNSFSLNVFLIITKRLFIWFISIFLCVLIFFFLSNIRLISFNKVIFEWFLIIMFLYWLLSGFTFFIKKYQFSKFTSVIQRFWRRSFIIFWLIETGVFLTFFYLTLNASEEIVFMSDQLKLFKSHLFSWKFFFIKIFLNIILILLSFFLLLSLNWSNFNKQNLFLLSITLLLLYLFWLEFYQFFHIVNFYSNLIWIFDFEEFFWNLDIEFRRTRISNNYVMLCLVAKFWHLVFIFVFWVFFILRVNELKRLRYPLFSANLQNFIILYLMSWLYMYPWLKFLFRNFLDINYSSFLINSNKNSIRIFFFDLKLFYFCLLNNLTKCNFNYIYFDFFYFFENSNLSHFSFKKHFLKSIFLSYFNK